MLTRRAILSKAALAASAIMVSHKPSAAANGDEHLVIADARGDYGLLAPFAHAANGPAYVYTSYVFDALVGQDNAGVPVPALADHWEPSDDGKDWNIVLNTRARWHDGAPVSASDVAFTIACMKENPYLFASTAGIQSVETADARTLTLRLAKPDSGFVNSVLCALPIMPRHIYEGKAEAVRLGDRIASTGSGPYRLAEYDKAQGRYLLTRNPDYYRGRPRFEQILIGRMGPDAALVEMQRGAVDIIPDLPVALVPRAKAVGAGVLIARSNHPERVVFNHRGLFATRNMRHAIAHILDRQALLDTVYPGQAVIAEIGYFQSGSQWHSDINLPAYPTDAVSAEKLLISEGWARTSNNGWLSKGEPIRLRLLTDGRYRRTATVVAEQLERFGLGVDLRILEAAALQQLIQSDDFDLLIRATSTIGDPGTIAGRVLANGWSGDRFPDTDGRFRSLLDEQAQTADPEQRRRILGRFQRAYAEELPSLMLVNPLWATAHNERVRPAFLPDGIGGGIPMSVPKSIFF